MTAEKRFPATRPERQLSPSEEGSNSTDRVRWHETSWRQFVVAAFVLLAGLCFRENSFAGEITLVPTGDYQFDMGHNYGGSTATSTRIGRGGDGAGVVGGAVYVFDIGSVPDLNYRTYLSADFSLYLTAKQGSINFNADLWHTQSGSSSTFNDLPHSGYAYGTADASNFGNPGDYRIQDNLLTPSTSTGRVHTSNTGDNALLNRIDNNFGSSSDRYMQFRVNPDINVPTNITGYVTSFKEAGAAQRPEINITYADADISVDDLDFGKALVGQSKVQYMRVRNTGDGGSRLTGVFGSVAGSFSTTGSSSFNLSAGASGLRPYEFDPSSRGDVTSSVNVFSNRRNVTVSLEGEGVAPVNAVSILDQVGATRLGTTNTATIRIQNVGDGNESGVASSISNLLGSVAGVSGELTLDTTSISLGDGATQDLILDYTPLNRGTDSRTVNLMFSNGSTDGTNDAETIAATIFGTGVGPTFASSLPVDSTIDFGEVSYETSGSALLDIFNSTADVEVDSLVGLTLLDAVISGDDADLFSLSGFTPGIVLSPAEIANVTVLFNPDDHDGFHSATLTFLTDQNAAYGAAGDSFSFELSGMAIAVPEPSSIVLGSLACILGIPAVIRHRRRGTNVA